MALVVAVTIGCQDANSQLTSHRTRGETRIFWLRAAHIHPAMTSPDSGNLLSDLALNEGGWLTQVGTARTDSNDAHVLIPSVEKLLQVLAPPPDGERKQSATAAVPVRSEEGLGIEAQQQQLRKVEGLHDLITRVFNDIERMAMPPDRKKGRERKLRQLRESQQMRSRQQQQQQQQGHEEEQDAAGLVDDNDDEEEEDTPSQRTLGTMNGIRSVLSQIAPMLLSNLRFEDNTNAKDKGGKKRVLLLGSHVFGTTTEKGFHALRRQLRDIVASSGETATCTSPDDYPSLVLQPLLDPSLGTTDGTIQQTLGIFLGKDGAAALETALGVDDVVLPRLAPSDAHLNDEHRASIQRLNKKLSSAIQTVIPDAELTIYGSCLSGLQLGKNSDVDISLHLPEALRLKEAFDGGRIGAKQYESKMKNIVFKVKHLVERRGRGSFVDLFAVTRARIPVIKGRDVSARCPYSDDGSLCFDICFLNDIAVCNSSLIGEYSKIDPCVRALMLAVKSFTKAKRIASAAEGTLSSYSWMILVIFYLQCIGFVPNLQDVELMKLVGFVPDSKNIPWHGVNGLNTAYLPSDLVLSSNVWKRNAQVEKLPVTALLYGFFKYYSQVFPSCIAAASIRLGRCALQKTSFARTPRIWRWCIEDPFEVSIN